MNSNQIRKKIYDHIMQVASKLVYESLSKQLNEEELNQKFKTLYDTMYSAIYDFVKADWCIQNDKIKDADKFKNELTEFDKKMLKKFSDIRFDSKAKQLKPIIIEFMTLLHKSPETLDELLDENGFFFYAQKLFNDNPNTNYTYDHIIKTLKEIKNLNFSEADFKKAEDRQKTAQSSDNIFANDFDDTQSNWGIPKTQSPKKFAFAALQDFNVNFPKEIKDACNKVAQELGYESWKDAFVNYGINLFSFIGKPYAEYVRGERQGGNIAKMRSENKYEYTKYAYTTRFACQWIFPEDFNPEKYLIDVCGRKRISNNYLENCKEVANIKVMREMIKNNYEGVGDRLKKWREMFKK